MNCDAVVKSIPLYFYGEVAPDAEDAIEEHLGTCAPCREEWERQKALAAALDRHELAPPAELLAECRHDLARAIAEISLDPGECYRVRDLTIVKEDARFYLTDGYLIFGKPVAGARVSAVFTADVEGGDAEVLLMPPVRSASTVIENGSTSSCGFWRPSARKALRSMCSLPYHSWK